MAVVTPPAITALPTAPDPNDRATFNARAYPWSAALATMTAEVSAVANNVAANATYAYSVVGSAQADLILAQAAAAAVAAANPVANAAAAQASAEAAAVSASLAQATNPDSPIRLNPRRITADFAVGSAYNASSTGPITLAPGVTVTVQDNATWSIT